MKRSTTWRLQYIHVRTPTATNALCVLRLQEHNRFRILSGPRALFCALAVAMIYRAALAQCLRTPRLSIQEQSRFLQGTGSRISERVFFFTLQQGQYMWEECYQFSLLPCSHDLVSTFVLRVRYETFIDGIYPTRDIRVVFGRESRSHPLKQATQLVTE